jgi:hypothetical protein
MAIGSGPSDAARLGHHQQALTLSVTRVKPRPGFGFGA